MALIGDPLREIEYDPVEGPLATPAPEDPADVELELETPAEVAA